MAHTVVLTLDSDSRGSNYSSNSTLDLFGLVGGGIHTVVRILTLDLLGGEVAHKQFHFNIRFIG